MCSCSCRFGDVCCLCWGEDLSEPFTPPSPYNIPENFMVIFSTSSQTTKFYAEPQAEIRSYIPVFQVFFFLLQLLCLRTKCKQTIFCINALTICFSPFCLAHLIFISKDLEPVNNILLRRSDVWKQKWISPPLRIICQMRSHISEMLCWVSMKSDTSVEHTGGTVCVCVYSTSTVADEATDLKVMTVFGWYQ